MRDQRCVARQGRAQGIERGEAGQCRVAEFGERGRTHAAVWGARDDLRGRVVVPQQAATAVEQDQSRRGRDPLPCQHPRQGVELDVGGDDGAAVTATDGHRVADLAVGEEHIGIGTGDAGGAHGGDVPRPHARIDGADLRPQGRAEAHEIARRSPVPYFRQTITSRARNPSAIMKYGLMGSRMNLLGEAMTNEVVREGITSLKLLCISTRSRSFPGSTYSTCPRLR